MGLMINGQYVDDGVLEAEFAGIKSYHERLGNVSCCERNDEFRGYARQNIIARVLLTQAAAARVPEPPGQEVEAALEKLKADHGGEQRFLYAVGATAENLDDIRREIATNLRVERLVDARCAGQAEPTDGELRSFYEEHQSSFMSPEEVRASHISRSPPRGESKQELYERYREVRRQLLAGGDFDELAREHSERGQEQIDLGFFRRGDLPEEFELVAFSMNVGEVNPVFGSSVGYHIIKVTDRRPSRPIPFEEARDGVLRQVVEQRRNETIRQLVAELQAEAKIEDVAEAVEPV
jgi:hypothetical protein